PRTARDRDDPGPEGPTRRRRPLPRADQGPRPGPARDTAPDRHGGTTRPALLDARRRLDAGDAGVDAGPRGVRPDQPRHAAPLPAPGARAVVPLLREPA